MRVRSLGFRTDLALLRPGGSRIEDRGDHLVVTSPHNPTFWWGNYLLLEHVPAEPDADRWLARFAAEHPRAQHVALGFDGTAGRVEHLAAFAARGLRTEAATVMTASSVHEPPRPCREAAYRHLVSDEDWAQSIELRMECDKDEDYGDAEHRVFVEAKTATNRALVQAGHARWYGAFLDGALVSQLGIVVAGQGLARFQSVETHPDVRGRGLAGTLVHHASREALAELGAQTLVMVADPDYLAIRVYRSVGFRDTETQLMAERPPGTSPT